MNEMFSANMKKAARIAQEEAFTLGNDFIGTEHLLLALIKDADSVPAIILAEAGLEYEKVRQIISDFGLVRVSGFGPEPVRPA